MYVQQHKGKNRLVGMVTNKYALSQSHYYTHRPGSAEPIAVMQLSAAQCDQTEPQICSKRQMVLSFKQLINAMMRKTNQTRSYEHINLRLLQS